MERIASWRIQTRHGATLGMVELCLGSQTLSRAFTTQVRIRTFNLASAAILCLWILSPLGSQASLRVISIVPSLSSTSTRLAIQNTSLEYGYGFAAGVSEAQMLLKPPVIASMAAARLLSERNQDLWGNVRFPAIESLESSAASTWLEAPPNTNMTYPSLLGTPVDRLPLEGNTSFIFPGYYLSISCEDFGRTNLSNFTNYTTSGAPSPGNDYDCKWGSRIGGLREYQLAISLPCLEPEPRSSKTVRPARRLVWESELTHAECSLTTTFVDVNMTCTGSLSGSSSGSFCDPHAVRRSVNPPFHGNWTGFDLGVPIISLSIIDMLITLFPTARTTGARDPVIDYLSQPFDAIRGYGVVAPVYTIGASTFQLRLAQLLNTILFVGIDARGFTGSFNSTKTDPPYENLIEVTAATTMQGDTVSCNMAWLGLLIAASLAAFFVALFSAFLRTKTLAPSVLGHPSIILLPNKIEGVHGSSTWASDTWAKKFGGLKLFLGDVQPEAPVGRIALTNEKSEFRPVQAERLYR